MKQFIEKLRAWKKAYDVFPSMAADREFQEMLDGFTPSNDEGGLPICKECGGHGYILERSGMGEEQEPTKCIECDGKGLVYPTPAKQEDGLVEALEKLARLGNGSEYGNSDGNRIAQDALAKYKGAK